MIGARHVQVASDNYGGMLGQDVIQRIPCAECKQHAKAHEYDLVMMLKLTRHTTNAECQAALKPVCDEITADGIDGFVFIETPEQFRIEKD